MRILYIDACVRSDSRTRRLADCLLARLGGEVETLRLGDLDFPKTDEAFLRRRDALIAAGRYDDPAFAPARQFAAAEEIVIAAPYWDLSFPAALKQYFEHINVLGLTFGYTPEGTPLGLCRAKKLWYVTTAGGAYVPWDYGFGYVEALARSFYGIPETELVRAAGLDIAGADPEAILREAMEGIGAGSTKADAVKEEKKMEQAVIDRITEMEGSLGDCAAATAALGAALDRMEALREPMTRLFAYYGSETWYEDRERELPPGLPAGVLSEDAVYDEITDLRDACFRMLELAADILKNRL